MDKLKELFHKVNAKVPLLQVLVWACILGALWMGFGLWEQSGFEPNFLKLYGLEDASVVRARVEEQMRRYKAKPAPPPPPPAQMSYDVRTLRQHNPYLPPGMIEVPMGGDSENKFTDVTGIELIGTVYSYVPTRRSALVEMNGIALVVMEGKMIRGTQKKVVEIGRSRVVVQEEGLMPSPVYLPHEYGLDDLTRALASNQYRTQPNWEYSARFGKGRKKTQEENAEDAEGGAEGEQGAEKKPAAKGKKKTAEEIAAEEEEAAAEEEEEEAAAEPAGAQGGVDIGGGE